jgi:hypothetical protein
MLPHCFFPLLPTFYFPLHSEVKKKKSVTKLCKTLSPSLPGLALICFNFTYTPYSFLLHLPSRGSRASHPVLLRIDATERSTSEEALPWHNASTSHYSLFCHRAVNTTDSNNPDTTGISWHKLICRVPKTSVWKEPPGVSNHLSSFPYSWEL